jgi:hypothetical protein
MFSASARFAPSALGLFCDAVRSLAAGAAQVSPLLLVNTARRAHTLNVATASGVKNARRGEHAGAAPRQSTTTATPVARRASGPSALRVTVSTARVRPRGSPGSAPRASVRKVSKSGAPALKRRSAAPSTERRRAHACTSDSEAESRQTAGPRDAAFASTVITSAPDARSENQLGCRVPHPPGDSMLNGDPSGATQPAELLTHDLPVKVNPGGHFERHQGIP